MKDPLPTGTDWTRDEIDALFDKLGLRAMTSVEPARVAAECRG